MSNKNNVFATVNAAVQTGAILASSAGVAWAMFPIMFMVAYISFMQTFAAAGIFSGVVKDSVEVKDVGYGLRALIGILYLLSSYQVYLIGYQLFAGFMFAHAAIFLLTNLLGVLKNK
jgi:xanthosine utilization system XapX-like protein